MHTAGLSRTDQCVLNNEFRIIKVSNRGSRLGGLGRGNHRMPPVDTHEFSVSRDPSV